MIDATIRADPPRRMTVRPLEEAGLPLLRPDLCGRIEVLLDGEVVQQCVAADADAGFVVCYRTDAEGRMLTSLGQPLLAWRHGRVETRWK